MVGELVQKYIWLIQTIIRAGQNGMDIGAIRRKWENRFGTTYSRRTFNNHRAAIYEAFGIEIECDRKTNNYLIKYADDITDSDASTAWLIDTFTVNSMLSLGRERLSGRVSVEEIPSGHKYLTALMEAMLECSELKVEYQKYDSSVPSIYTLQPYAIKEYSKRWYLIAYCIERDSIRVYGLDRIMGIEPDGETFRMPDGFDIDMLFANSFGVYISDAKPKKIVFRASLKDALYLRDLPIHKSQKELYSDENSTTFSIFVQPNKSLVMEFLKLGDKVEVVSPDSFRKEIASKAAAMHALYNDCCKNTLK